MKIAFAIICCFVLFNCSQNKVVENESFQTIGLLGDSLFTPKLSKNAQARLEDNLAKAIAAYQNEPSEENYIWLGRRTAYLGQYRKAQTIFTEGLERFPGSYRLLRHRGHRYVSLREFDKAISDFEAAYELMPKNVTETEQDGIPNRINQPLSNTQFNILYHWGLAYYLLGNYQEAESIYLECMKYSDNDDLITATADWLYMTQRRANKVTEAATTLSMINTEMDIIENQSYYKRLLMYSGKLPVDSLFDTNDEDVQLSLITQGYGVANWYLYNQDTSTAKEILSSILENESWSPFGYIAAERDFSLLR